jgi:hypothetical protein
MHVKDETATYDHRTLRTELPVRSAELKQCTGGLVVRWVTTGEYPLLYVFEFFFEKMHDRIHPTGPTYMTISLVALQYCRGIIIDEKELMYRLVIYVFVAKRKNKISFSTLVLTTFEDRVTGFGLVPVL